MTQPSTEGMSEIGRGSTRTPAENEVRRPWTHADVLHKLIQDLTRSLTPDEVLRRVFTTLMPHLRFDAAVSVLCREGDDATTVYSAAAIPEGTASGLASGLIETFLRFSGGVHHDCQRPPFRVERLLAGEGASPIAGPQRSAADAPLIVRGRAAGLLRVLAERDNAFPPDETRLLYSAASLASAALERSEAPHPSDDGGLQALIGGLDDGIVLVRDGGKPLANEAARRLLAALCRRPEVAAGDPSGREQEVPLEETPVAALVEEVRATGQRRQVDYAVEDGQRRHLAVKALPLGGFESGVVVVLREVTEERLLQERLMQSEKMASVGQLVSGVAHELNNPLTGIMGFAQLLLTRELDERSRHEVETIQGEAERAAKIVQNLLSFARRRKAEKELANLNTLLERVLELRSYDLRLKNIALDLQLDPQLPLTMVDPDHIQQVFFNIVTNAEHAMLEAHGQGHLTVRSSADGGYIRISFTDDGPGLSPENLRRVFDPFFTTKKVGEGTGLGLTIAYGIVEDHGGRMRAESSPGRGATFVAELPVVQGPAQREVVEEREMPRAQVGASSILVVDDESSIQSLLRDVLNMDGHQVDVASSGAEALRSMYDRQYDLIITDIKMPEMSGPEFYRRVRDIDREQAERMVFITGDTVNVATRQFLQKVSNPCLVKPFKVEDIREIVQRQLRQA
jgi:signal transduction histidine kinase/ActR/RegA family two-component response regulator